MTSSYPGYPLSDAERQVFIAWVKREAEALNPFYAALKAHDMATTKDRPKVKAPHVWVDLELGDTELQVLEHADGMFELTIAGEQQLLLNEDGMRDVSNALQRLRISKGWRQSVSISHE